MALQLIRLNDYHPGDFVIAQQWNAEFDNMINRISINPARHPLPLTAFSATAPATSTKFPQWICPDNTSITISSLMFFYTAGATGSYRIRFYKNGSDAGVEVHVTVLNSHPNKDKEYSLGGVISLVPGDILQPYLSLANNSDFVNVTIQACGLLKWLIPATASMDDPATRFTTFVKRSIIEAADLEGEVENVKAYWDAMTFSYIHTAFFAGEPTTASKTAIFVVPSGWLAASMVQWHMIFHTGTSTAAFSAGLYKNGSLQDTISFAAGDLVDTDVPLALSISVTPLDVIEIKITDETGAQKDVTVQVDFEYQINAAYNRSVPAFNGVIESAEFSGEIDSLCGFFNTTKISQTLATYWDNPAGTDRRAILMLPDNAVGITIKNVYGYFTGGSATGNTTFTIKKNNATLVTFGFIGAGDPINTVKSGSINEAAERSDRITITPAVVTGSQTEITIFVEVECELI